MPSARKTLNLTVALVVALVVGGVYFGALYIGVWLPDLVLPRRTLASTVTPGGHSLRVVQYLNGADFYTTMLVHTSPSGKVSNHVLDGDDCFSWRVPLEVHEPVRVATVRLSQNRKRSIRW